MGERTGHLTLQEAFLLFRRLGVDAQTLSEPEFSIAYLDLARRYHPDIGNRNTHGLMANINAARTVIQQAYRKSETGRGSWKA
jgi:DnaJ-class molecular chaperone